MPTKAMATLSEYALRAVADAVVVTDADGSVAVWNPAAEQLFGRPAATALRRPGEELFVYDDVPRTAPDLSGTPARYACASGRRPGGNPSS